jgi:hypothetical protein
MAVVELEINLSEDVEAVILVAMATRQDVYEDEVVAEVLH